jgi:hypothetical protein
MTPWLTRAGLAAAGLPYTPTQPALGRLAHIRAVLAVRLSLETSPAFGDGQAWWRSERRIRAVIGGPAAGHVADAEVSWPDVPGSPYPGECWAIEAELTPKPLARTVAIMTAWPPAPATTSLVRHQPARPATPVWCTWPPPPPATSPAAPPPPCRHHWPNG